MNKCTKSLKASKINGYVIEPVKDGYTKSWEGFHTTNPCVIRLSKDSRVFLGYRAGGDDDHYSFNGTDIWGSSLGMAVMDECGDKIIHRFPFPVMKIVRDFLLPQNKEEYTEYIKIHKDDIVVLHDFRLFEHGDYLYVIYHDGTVDGAFDCIARMSINTFLSKIKKSIELIRYPAEEILDEWHTLWWEKGTWEPCGVDGTRLLFGSDNRKNDVVFSTLSNGSLLMCHRPLPDIAVLNTGADTFAKATSDGIKTYGTLETCVRPGYFDNSHIGSNGTPIKARIGSVDVYIDVTHGVNNKAITDAENDKLLVIYLPYFRVRDYETGELLYYSQNPILDLDEIWKEYVEEGEWVSRLEAIIGVIFPGGQIEIEAGRNGLDDMFAFYTGVGDTAVAKAVFKLRDLLPDETIADIQSRKGHLTAPAEGVYCNRYSFPEKISGWNWYIENDIRRRNINIKRVLNKDGETEQGVKVINSVPGNFDADCALFDGKSIRYLDGLGWGLIYKGVRLDTLKGRNISKIGYGILLLDEENPEKVLYRSTTPLEDKSITYSGWSTGSDTGDEYGFLDRMDNLIPEKVKFEVKRTKHLISIGQSWSSDMTKWLLDKAYNKQR